MQRALTETEKKWDSNVKEFSAKQTESAKRFIAEVWDGVGCYPEDLSEALAISS